jgi:hypothetical protein
MARLTYILGGFSNDRERCDANKGSEEKFRVGR